jgi:hypothetical protein
VSPGFEGVSAVSKSILRAGWIPKGVWGACLSFAGHDPQHAFVGDEKASKVVRSVAHGHQPFPNLSGNTTMLPRIANLLQGAKFFVRHCIRPRFGHSANMR